MLFIDHTHFSRTLCVKMHEVDLLNVQRCINRGLFQQCRGYDKVNGSTTQWTAAYSVTKSDFFFYRHWFPFSRDFGTTNIPASPHREVASAPHQQLATPSAALAYGEGTEGRKRRSPSSYRGKGSKLSRPDALESLFGNGSNSGGILASGPDSQRQVIVVYRLFEIHYYTQQYHSVWSLVKILMCPTWVKNKITSACGYVKKMSAFHYIQNPHRANLTISDSLMRYSFWLSVPLYPTV